MQQCRRKLLPPIMSLFSGTNLLCDDDDSHQARTDQSLSLIFFLDVAGPVNSSVQEKLRVRRTNYIFTRRTARSLSTRMSLWRITSAERQSVSNATKTESSYPARHEKAILEPKLRSNVPRLMAGMENDMMESFESCEETEKRESWKK